LAFLAACGSVNETFEIKVVTVDAGPKADVTVPDGDLPETGPADTGPLADVTVPDVGAPDTGAPDTGSGPVVPDGGSVVMVGDAAVVIPPFDPALIADGGIVISDGGLANADGGALTPRQFRDLVNGITCQRISECCCPGCSAADQATIVSRTKCETGLGANGLQLILTGNEFISAASRVIVPSAQTQCLALLDSALRSCASLRAEAIRNLRAVCLDSYRATIAAGAPCFNAFDCQTGLRCVTADGGRTCQPLAPIGASCVSNNDCSTRGIQGIPPAFCNPADGGSTCSAYFAEGERCPYNAACGGGACIVSLDGTNRCSNTLPFASTSDPASFCTGFAP
jgi:hypothetical protein